MTEGDGQTIAPAHHRSEAQRNIISCRRRGCASSHPVQRRLRSVRTAASFSVRDPAYPLRHAPRRRLRTSALSGCAAFSRPAEDCGRRRRGWPVPSPSLFTSTPSSVSVFSCSRAARRASSSVRTITRTHRAARTNPEGQPCAPRSSATQRRRLVVPDLMRSDEGSDPALHRAGINRSRRQALVFWRTPTTFPSAVANRRSSDQAVSTARRRVSVATRRSRSLPCRDSSRRAAHLARQKRRVATGLYRGAKTITASSMADPPRPRAAHDSPGGPVAICISDDQVLVFLF